MISSQRSRPDCALVHLRLSHGTRAKPGLTGDNPMEKPGVGTGTDGEVAVATPSVLCPAWWCERRRGIDGDVGGEIADSEAVVCDRTRSRSGVSGEVGLTLDSTMAGIHSPSVAPPSRSGTSMSSSVDHVPILTAWMLTTHTPPRRIRMPTVTRRR